MTKEESLERAKALRNEDKLEESQELLLSLLEEYPNDPIVLFEVGGSYDVMGEESDAIPYYEDAIEQGLDGVDLLECYICLSSVQRVIGDSQEAVDTLEDAIERYPEDNSAKAFLALGYYSNEQYSESVRLLLEILLETTDDEQIKVYSDTLDFYKDNLDEIWDE